MADNLITVQDAAKERGVSTARIHQWINDGRLKRTVKYGRTLIDVRQLKGIKAKAAGRPKSE